MPELPEVQTIINDLNQVILNKKIATIDIRKSRLVKGSDSKFKKTLINNQFSKISRRGKLIIFSLKTYDLYLLIHLKMTGQLIYQSGKKVIAGGHSDTNPVNDLPNKHTHVIFTFSDKSKLYFNDLRTFGYLQLVDEKQLEKIKSKFGIEPLSQEFTLEKFEEMLKGKNTAIKTFLLNQKFVVGLGNIYADEVCFDAGVKPQRRIKTLTKDEKQKIFKAIPKILKKSIKYRGTTFSDFVDGQGRTGNFVNHLKAHQQEGKQCPRCKKETIIKIKLNGRGTYYCPNCQK
ncbi:bifunctional DNA-formamidopyrimidine glycosylase/DNA-(apurinic or apyrimidinic site) lyase [Patescibacteria group bacterium]|nr:bifunctional DNA-formamidopyrimidine glycosylase/DNA-(apurinic or apyrimidinic site) lyase [Patescibacteria group bacterium]